jgi:hypothetical protein
VSAMNIMFHTREEAPVKVDVRAIDFEVHDGKLVALLPRGEWSADLDSIVTIECRQDTWRDRLLFALYRTLSRT